jgi:hypothetical protein
MPELRMERECLAWLAEFERAWRALELRLS